MKGRNLLALILAGLAGGCGLPPIFSNPGFISFTGSPLGENPLLSKKRLDLTPGIWLSTGYRDVNKDGKVTRDEISGMNKKVFDVSKESVVIVIYPKIGGKNRVRLDYEGRKALESREFDIWRGAICRFVLGDQNLNGRYKITSSSRNGERYSAEFEITGGKDRERGGSKGPRIYFLD